MKKKWMLSILTVLCAGWAGADALLERFDEEPAIGKILGGAAIDPQGGLERGALKVTGNGQSLQYFYRYDVAGKPGDKFAVALDYKTTPGLVSNTFLILVTFDPAKGGQAPASVYFKLPKSSARWLHRQFEFTIPEGAVNTHIMLRLAGVPASESAWIDHFRVAPVVDGVAKGIDLETFETSFEDWSFDRHLIFDHFMPGPGGKVVNEWREAKIGEAFFQASGDDTPMQYALYIDDIKVKPNANYVFEAWYQATDGFKFQGNGILIFFYKDAEGKAVGQSRFHFRPTGGEWKELLHSFTTPENCAFVDIGLNMRNRKPEEFIRLDHIRLKSGGDKLYVRTETDSAQSAMTVTTALTGNLAPDDVTVRSFTIRNEDGSVVKTFDTPVTEAQTKLDLKQFSDGVYMLEPVLTLKDGRKLTAEPVAFGVFNHPEWANDLGIQKPAMTPPKPWTALRAEGKDEIANWNGKLAFTPGLLLRQITAGGEDLLSRPLEITVNGEPLTAASDRNFQVEPSLATAEAEGPAAGFEAHWRTTVDYLGFVRYTLEITAPKAAALRSLKVALPLKSVDFVNRTDGSWTEVGAVDLKRHKVWESNRFYDNIMLGDIDRGISFYLPKAYPAVREFKQNWVRADREGLTVELVNEPIELKAAEKRSFEFAFCAYPFRPRENNWRKLRFRAGKNNNFDLVWQTDPMFKYAGSLAVSGNDERMKKYLENKVEYQLFYQIPTYILEKIPAWSFFQDQWRAMPSRAYDMEQFGPLTKGDFRKRSWCDLYVKTLAEMMAKFPWDGVYYDCFGTDVFTENGESFNPVFELRDFQERIYNVQRLHDPNSLTVVHAGAGQGETMVSFADVVLMGEQYRGQFMTHTYYPEFLTMDEFRYENAVNIGPDRMLLPQYRHAEKTSSPLTSTHVMGMALLHNLMIYPNFIRKDIELAIRDRQYAFGMNDAEFFGYWKPNPDGVKSSNPEVYVSYYKNARGLFLCALNYSARQQATDLSVNGSFAKSTVFDPVTGKEAPFTGKLEIGPYLALFIELDR